MAWILLMNHRGHFMKSFRADDRSRRLGHDVHDHPSGTVGGTAPQTTPMGPRRRPKDRVGPLSMHESDTAPKVNSMGADGAVLLECDGKREPYHHVSIYNHRPHRSNKPLTRNPLASSLWG